MKNNILKIINEKYEKIFHRLQQNKVPEIRALWDDEAFIFRALPHIFFGQNRSSPPPKNGPYAYAYIAHNMAAKTAGIDKERNYATVTLPTVQTAC